MINQVKYVGALAVICFLLGACNVYRYVPENDHLYKGGTIVLNNKAERIKYAGVKKELTKLPVV